MRPADAKSELQHGTAALPLPAHGVLSNANPHDSSGPQPCKGGIEGDAVVTPFTLVRVEHGASGSTSKRKSFRVTPKRFECPISHS